MNRRIAKRLQGSRHEDFTFSGLISCGHCGCALVAEIKKGRYVYDHCTGSKDERRSHDEQIAHLQAEHARLQTRLDAMYVDKLDGRVDASYFDLKAAEWRSEQRSLLRRIEEHQVANESYLDEGMSLLELAKRAHLLFKKQKPNEKRRLLDFVISNRTWKNGELHSTYR